MQTKDILVVAAALSHNQTNSLSAQKQEGHCLPTSRKQTTIDDGKNIGRIHPNQGAKIYLSLYFGFLCIGRKRLFISTNRSDFKITKPTIYFKFFFARFICFRIQRVCTMWVYSSPYKACEISPHVYIYEQDEDIFCKRACVLSVLGCFYYMVQEKCRNLLLFVVYCQIYCNGINRFRFISCINPDFLIKQNMCVWMTVYVWDSGIWSKSCDLSICSV